MFLGFRGRFLLAQETGSTAAFANLSHDVSDRWRLAAGIRHTRDDKRARTNVGTGTVAAERRWDETSWDLSTHYRISDLLGAYATVQSGYQSGQFPARPYCLFADPNCFAAGDNITALNQEVGVKGQPHHRLELSAALFRTRYKDLPYQVSTTAGAGFNTVNLIAQQRTAGLELEGVLHLGAGLRFEATLGYVDAEVDPQRGVRPVAPLTPKLTASISPEVRRGLANGGEIGVRLDYSYRAAMWGEPSSDPGRLTRIPSRALINFHIGYTSPDDGWHVAVYGRNAADTRYDNARLNTGDYVLRILSNDPSEFGVRAERRF